MSATQKTTLHGERHEEGYNHPQVISPGVVSPCLPVCCTLVVYLGVLRATQIRNRPFVAQRTQQAQIREQPLVVPIIEPLVARAGAIRPTNNHEHASN